MKRLSYDRPDMEIVMLDRLSDIITLSQGLDNGETPEVDFEEIW